jgi:hypothetical protein
MSMNNSNGTIGNQTRDFPACSAETQPTASPRASLYINYFPFLVTISTTRQLPVIFPLSKWCMFGQGFSSCWPTKNTDRRTDSPKERKFTDSGSRWRRIIHLLVVQNLAMRLCKRQIYFSTALWKLNSQICVYLYAYPNSMSASYTDWGFFTLIEVFSCFFLTCKANAWIKLAKTGHGQYSLLFGCYLCCSMQCSCVNVYCHRVTTQLQLINTSYHISLSLQKSSQISIAYDVDCESLNIACIIVCWAAVLNTYRQTLHITLMFYYGEPLLRKLMSPTWGMCKLEFVFNRNLPKLKSFYKFQFRYHFKKSRKFHNFK